jgi:hypothetical protein
MAIMAYSPSKSLEERIARLWSTPGTTTYKVTTLLDGRRIDTRDHCFAWLAEDALARLGTDSVATFPDGRRLDSREAINAWLEVVEDRPESRIQPREFLARDLQGPEARTTEECRTTMPCSAKKSSFTGP